MLRCPCVAAFLPLVVALLYVESQRSVRPFLVYRNAQATYQLVAPAASGLLSATLLAIRVARSNSTRSHAERLPAKHIGLAAAGTGSLMAGILYVVVFFEMEWIALAFVLFFRAIAWAFTRSMPPTTK